MSRVFTLEWGWRSLDWFCSFNKLKTILCLDCEFSLVSEEISIVSKDTVICCSWDRDTESTIHIISKFQLKTETHRFIELPSQINSYLLFGDPNIESFRETYFDSNISYIINELALEITILISIIKNSKTWCCLDVKWYDRHHDLSFVEVKHR